MKHIIGKKILRFVFVLLAAAALVLPPSTASACPTCKDGMAANDPEHEHMVKGYFYSILFMMGMPYLLFTSFSLYMYLEVRKARARDAAAKGQNPLDPKKPFAPASAAVAVPSDMDAEHLHARELAEV